MERLLSPARGSGGREILSPPPRPLTLEGNGDGGSGDEEEPANGTRDKRDLERGIREALFRVGDPPAAKPYKGRPLQGAWATGGLTGVLGAGKQGEPRENYPVPVKFNVGSPESSSGCTTPNKNGSRTPQNSRDNTSPRQSQSPNWSTPSRGRGCRGDRGRYQHSHSGPAQGYNMASSSSVEQRQRTSPRRYNSDQYPVQPDQSNHQNQSHDRGDQSYPSDWNIHLAGNPQRGNGDNRRRGGRGWGQHNGPAHRERGSEGGERRRGEREGGERRERRGRGREGGGRGRYRDSGSHYQRSRSDIAGQSHARGGGVSSRTDCSSRPPYSEPPQ